MSISKEVKGPAPETPPPTPKTSGTSRASFFSNLDHSYVDQTEAQTSSNVGKDPVPETPPPTPVNPGTSTASFFPNLDHSYGAQSDLNPEIKASEHSYCAQEKPNQAVPNPEIRAGPTRVTASKDQSSALEFDVPLVSGVLPNTPKITDAEILQELRSTIERLQTEVDYKKSILDAASKLFQPEQIDKFIGAKKHVVYSDKAITEALQLLFACGHTGYELLIEKGYPLPSVRTLNRHLLALKITTGLIDDSFKLLGFRAKNSTPEENEVVLSIDELSIKPEIKFDTTNKCLSGFINIPRSKDDKPKGTYALKMLRIFFLCVVSKY